MIVVDDDPATLDILTNLIHAQGLECLACPSALEAMAALETFRPRLIISDWQMPGIDGLELCRRVRALGSGSPNGHIHFVMLTVHAQLEQLSRAFDAGVDDFLAKPFNEADLIAQMRSGLRVVALYDELSRQHQGSRMLNEQLTNLTHRLEKLAITHDLTGLYNRREAMHRLEEHWTLGDHYRGPVAIVTLDIDHFKNFNDEHGHAAGTSCCAASPRRSSHACVPLMPLSHRRGGVPRRPAESHDPGSGVLRGALPAGRRGASVCDPGEAIAGDGQRRCCQPSPGHDPVHGPAERGRRRAVRRETRGTQRRPLRPWGSRFNCRVTQSG